MNSRTQELAAKVANPYATESTTESSTAGAGMVSSQAMAAVQGAVMMAKQFPRNQREAMNRILDACTRPGLAAEAQYAYPRGGETVSGPSIRLAEVIAQCWGNIDFGMVELSQEGGRSQVMAYAWDLETNVRQQKIFVTGHIRHTRKGDKILTDGRDIYELVANQGARRVRACILGIIPKDVIDAALQQVHITLENTMGAPDEEIRQMVTAFEAFGVTEQQIQARLGKSFKAVTRAEVIRMRQVYASLRDGMSSPEQWFDAEPADDQPKAKTQRVKEQLATEAQ